MELLEAFWRKVACHSLRSVQGGWHAGGRPPEAATMDRDDASESGVSTADGTADEDEEVRVLNAGKHREDDIDPDFERELAALVIEHQGPGSALSASLPQVAPLSMSPSLL